MLNYNLFLQHFCAFAAFGTGPVQTSYDRFLAVLTGPGPGPLSSGNFKDRSGHRSVKNRVKKPDRTGPLSTMHKVIFENVSRGLHVAVKIEIRLI